MNDIKSKMNRLFQQIDGLTTEIADSIARNVLEDTNVLLNRRHSIIAELVDLPTNDSTKQTLIEYLDKIRRRDQHIMQILKEDRDKIKQTLLNVDKVKGYVE